MEVELKTTNDEYQKLQSDYNETCARVKELESNLQTQRTQHEEHNARLCHGLNDLLNIAKPKFILTQMFGTEMETVYKVRRI
ncbi:hypothetical protein BKA69DRAFT_1058589 [Paraphysoderma sedebokerense]|nr:hypothetical protein BKA69DRAFT_1058589 [Paraphysoderma sedebokerense]